MVAGRHKTTGLTPQIEWGKDLACVESVNNLSPSDKGTKLNYLTPSDAVSFDSFLGLGVALSVCGLSCKA